MAPDPGYRHRGVPVDILLVEDDPGDVLLTREAFAEHKLHNRLTVLSDGIDAVMYLRGIGRHAGRRRPDLVLLDLNLPGIGGHEVLAVVRGDAMLADIPVVVLTGSAAEEDLLRSRLAGVSAYLRKPVQFSGLVALVREIDMFHLSVHRAPPAGGVA